MPVQPSRNPPSSASEPPVRGQRADARHNRARLLRAAREAYALNGTDVPSSTIARRAGVGAATLYRHFPTRGSLIAAAFSEQFSECVAALDEALRDDDPGRGLCSALTKVCRMQAEDRGFSAAFLEESPDDPDLHREHARAEAGLAQLVQRAKNTGQSRKDFDPSDVTLLLLANSGVVRQSPEASLAASRRLLAYFLQSCRATDGAPPLPQPAPPRRRLRAATPNRLTGDFRRGARPHARRLPVCAPANQDQHRRDFGSDATSTARPAEHRPDRGSWKHLRQRSLAILGLGTPSGAEGLHGGRHDWVA